MLMFTQTLLHWWMLMLNILQMMRPPYGLVILVSQKLRNQSALCAWCFCLQGAANQEKDGLKGEGLKYLVGAEDELRGCTKPSMREMRIVLNCKSCHGKK